MARPHCVPVAGQRPDSRRPSGRKWSLEPHHAGRGRALSLHVASRRLGLLLCRTRRVPSDLGEHTVGAQQTVPQARPSHEHCHLLTTGTRGLVLPESTAGSGVCHPRPAGQRGVLAVNLATLTPEAELCHLSCDGGALVWEMESQARGHLHPLGRMAGAGHGGRMKGGEKVEDRMGKWVDRRMEGWMDRLTDGCVDRRMAGWMDRLMHG